MQAKTSNDIPFERVEHNGSLLIGEHVDFFVKYVKENTPVTFGVTVDGTRYQPFSSGIMRSKTLQGLVNMHYRVCSVESVIPAKKKSMHPK